MNGMYCCRVCIAVVYLVSDDSCFLTCIVSPLMRHRLLWSSAQLSSSLVTLAQTHPPLLYSSTHPLSPSFYIQDQTRPAQPKPGSIHSPLLISYSLDLLSVDYSTHAHTLSTSLRTLSLLTCLVFLSPLDFHVPACCYCSSVFATCSSCFFLSSLSVGYVLYRCVLSKLCVRVDGWVGVWFRLVLSCCVVLSCRRAVTVYVEWCERQVS